MLKAMQQNPWLLLPNEPPYVLHEDMPFIKEFNAQNQKNENAKIVTELLPSPFSGCQQAPVVILMLNPGHAQNDLEHHNNSVFKNLMLKDLHSPDSTRHFYLSDPTRGPGYDWWMKACKQLIKDVGFDHVSKGILSVEFSPYPSKTFAHAHLRLPSQSFGFGLVYQAMERKALIVCMRGFRIWTGAVPELGSYENLIRPINNRTSALSSGNLPGYERLKSALLN